MANYLVRNGHNIVKVSDSEINLKLKIFLFHDSIALRNTMANFKRQGGISPLSNVNQNRILVGISQKELFCIPDYYKNVSEAFIDRNRDYIKIPVPQQVEFAKDMFELIAKNTDTSKITVIPGRCGISKSTFISALMSYFCTFDSFEYRGKDAIGIIIVTDKLERLKEYQDDPQHIQSFWGDMSDYKNISKYSTYISSDGDKRAMDLLIESRYKPIVLLSTQRYFSMPDEQREMLFEYQHTNYKNEKIMLKREILIFDEKPYFSNTVSIGVKNFNDVSTALQNGIPESLKNREDKDWLLQEYRKFRDKMETLLREKEKTSSNKDRFYWRDKNTANLTSNDDRFFELANKHKSSIIKVYSNAMTDLRLFKSIMTQGAFFTTNKKSKQQEYETYLEVYVDNRCKFYLGEDKVKCFVFDATADIDPDYKIDYLQMIDCSKYNIPLNLTINFLDVPASKSVLVNAGDTSNRINAIYKTIKADCHSKDDGNTLIVTYKQITDKFKGLEFDVIHFGGCKGINNFISDCKFCHVGNNRFDPFAYLLKLISQNPTMLKLLQKKDEVESRKLINELTKMNPKYKGIFANSEINEIMFSSILADFEQNIFRTAIRDFNNEVEVTVYTFWNCTTFELLNNMIEDRYDSYGVKFNYLGVTDTVKKLDTLTRKPKDGVKTNPQKIIKWYESQEKGRVFKLSEMLSSLDITNKQFQKAKEKNTTIQTMFVKSTTKKQGYYKVG